MRFSGVRVPLFTAPAIALSCLLLLALCKKTQSYSGLSSSLLCPALTLEDTILVQQDQCLVDGNRAFGTVGGIKSKVTEMNGTTLERALSLIQSRNDAHVAVLFYAEWCPFSKSLRPTFDTLSSSFPAIHHFAVEESALRPSALSQYGVHSFPSLFLNNKTSRIRYYGPRTVEALGRFYKDITGLQPIDPSNRVNEEVALIRKLSTKGLPQSGENCPYPWAKSPEKWLHDDMYLTLATVFLILRLFHYLLPKILTSIKYYWDQKETSRQAHKAVLGRDLLLDAEQEQRIRSSGKDSKGKSLRIETLQENKEAGKAVLSVPGWSSSSLAPVTLAEGSSSRAGGIEEGRENGRAYRGHLWG